jgi:uridine kinase
MHLTRPELIEQLTATLIGLDASRPALVAVDGRSAAGKSTLADELAQSVAARGRPALRSSIDDFHPPGHKYRSRDRGYTPASYYAEGYDYALFRTAVLDPARPGGSRRCRLAGWDSLNDRALPERWTEVAPGAILLVDGMYLLSPRLRHYWDYAIWVEVDWETMVERAAGRDVAWVGSADVVRERYRTFWIPAHRFYEDESEPRRYAHVLIDNRDPHRPAVVKHDPAASQAPD